MIELVIHFDGWNKDPLRFGYKMRMWVDINGTPYYQEVFIDEKGTPEEKQYAVQHMARALKKKYFDEVLNVKLVEEPKNEPAGYRHAKLTGVTGI